MAEKVLNRSVLNIMFPHYFFQNRGELLFQKLRIELTTRKSKYKLNLEDDVVSK